MFENSPITYVLSILSVYWLIGALAGLTIIYAMSIKPEEVEKYKQQIWDGDDDEVKKLERIAFFDNKALIFLMMVFFWPFILTKR